MLQVTADHVDTATRSPAVRWAQDLGATCERVMTMSGARDRDPDGRARQARPRDALGRPLAYGEAGVEPVSEEPLPPEETLRVAKRLLNEGRAFSAHEVCEARWKSCPADERDLWQGLAQLCVGLTHHARGNIVGAARLVERGSGRLRRHAATGATTYGLDLDDVIACAHHQVTSPA